MLATDTTDAPARPWAVLAYSLVLDAAEVREGTTGLTVGQRNYLDTLDNDDIGAAIEAAVEELGLMKHYAQTRQRAAQLLLDRAADQPVLVLPDDTGAPSKHRPWWAPSGWTRSIPAA